MSVSSSVASRVVMMPTGAPLPNPQPPADLAPGTAPSAPTTSANTPTAPEPDVAVNSATSPPARWQPLTIPADSVVVLSADGGDVSSTPPQSPTAYAASKAAQRPGYSGARGYHQAATRRRYSPGDAALCHRGRDHPGDSGRSAVYSATTRLIGGRARRTRIAGLQLDIRTIASETTVDTMARMNRKILILSLAFAVALTGVVAVGIVVVSNQANDDGECSRAFVRVKLSGNERSVDVEFLNADLRPTGKLTSDGQSREPEFSPDGQRVVFASGRGYASSPTQGNEKQSIYVIDSDGDNERRLTRDYFDTEPTWSPDGSQIAFLRSETRAVVGDDLRLMVIDVASGEQREILFTKKRLERLTWLSNSRLAYGEIPAGANNIKRLQTVSVAGGESETLFEFQAPASWTDLVWSPDRSKIAISYIQRKDAVQVIELRTGRTTDVPNSASEVAGPVLWAGDNNLLFTRETRGAGFTVMASKGGTGVPVSVGEMDAYYQLPQSDNPRCSP